MPVSSHAACGNLIWWLISGSPMSAEVPEGDSRHARIHQLESEVAMLREELRINGRA